MGIHCSMFTDAFIIPYIVMYSVARHLSMKRSVVSGDSVKDDIHLSHTPRLCRVSDFDPSLILACADNCTA